MATHDIWRRPPPGNKCPKGEGITVFREEAEYKEPVDFISAELDGSIGLNKEGEVHLDVKEFITSEGSDPLKYDFFE